MILVYILILIFALYGVKPQIQNKDYLSKKQSAMIKGIFVLLVFASHSSSYVEKNVLSQSGQLSSAVTVSFFYIRHWLGQMIVVPFLFYSGYGIRLSISRKGNEYINALPRNRILKTYVHTVLIILLFYLLQLILGEQYSGKQVVLSFLLWDNFGNSNWYMFAIILLYLATYFSFRLFTDQQKALSMCLFLTLIYFVVMWRTKEPWWYNTVIVYWFGLIYPDIQGKVESFTNRSFKLWFISCLAAFCVIALLTLWGTGYMLIDGLLDNIRAIVLMLGINMFLQRFTIGNRALQWLGNHVFEIYLLQRLPMILFTKIGLADLNVVIWYVVCAITTLILTILCERLLRDFDRKTFAIK